MTMRCYDRWVRVFVAILALAGCRLGAPPDAGPIVCASGEASVIDGAPVTRVYVVNALQLPMPSSDGSEIDGFDLDGTADLVCGQADYNASQVDCGSSGGIDNSLSGFLGPLANDSIQKRVDRAEYLLLLRVDGIDSFVDDSSVTLTVLLGRLPDGALPVHVGACSTENTTDPDCRLAPGQTVDADAMSFSDGLLGAMPLLQFPSAAIVEGRLAAEGVDLQASMGFGLPTIRRSRLTVAITDTTLSRGVWGGAITEADLVSEFSGPPYCGAFLGGWFDITPYADMMPTTAGACGSTTHCPAPARCDVATHTCVSCLESSIAFDFAAVAAAEGAIVTTPPMDAGVAACPVDGGSD